eukprot:m.177338 g.177338  ORF g.177338 m.177338 type:complete len:575 (-) comp13545_c2_seq14:1942-3666(-)
MNTGGEYIATTTPCTSSSTPFLSPPDSSTNPAFLPAVHLSSQSLSQKTIQKRLSTSHPKQFLPIFQQLERNNNSKSFANISQQKKTYPRDKGVVALTLSSSLASQSSSPSLSSTLSSLTSPTVTIQNNSNNKGSFCGGVITNDNQTKAFQPMTTPPHPLCANNTSTSEEYEEEKNPFPSTIVDLENNNSNSDIIDTPQPLVSSSSSSTSSSSRKRRKSKKERTEFICPKCGKTYNRREHLSRHVRSHTPRSSWHKCCKCHKRFHRRDHLNYHMALHGVVPRYLCAHGGCNVQFSDRKDLLEHQRVCLHFGIDYAQLDKEGNLHIDDRKPNDESNSSSSSSYPVQGVKQQQALSPLVSLQSLGLQPQPTPQLTPQPHILQQQQRHQLQNMQPSLHQPSHQLQIPQQQQPLLHSMLEVTRARPLPDPLLSMPSAINNDSINNNDNDMYSPAGIFQNAQQQKVQQYLLNVQRLQLQAQIQKIEEMEVSLSRTDSIIQQSVTGQHLLQQPHQQIQQQQQLQPFHIPLRQQQEQQNTENSDWITLYHSLVGSDPILNARNPSHTPATTKTATNSPSDLF